MTYYSLLCPLKTLTWFQLLLWPLIYAQLISLKMWVRKHYGRGVPYRFWVSPFGRVYLVQFPPDLTQSFSAPGALILPEFTFTTGIGTGAHARASLPAEPSVHAAPALPLESGVSGMASHGPDPGLRRSRIADAACARAPPPTRLRPTRRPMQQTPAKAGFPGSVIALRSPRKGERRT
mgnify:CR=1 FL=1